MLDALEFNKNASRNIISVLKYLRIGDVCLMNRSHIEKLFMDKMGRLNTYFDSWKDNLLDGITPKLFENELREGDGSELDGSPAKFASITSWSALAVNSFAIWKKNDNLKLFKFDKYNGFDSLKFERKFSNGLQGNNPNLDVTLESDEVLIAIECKFLELLKRNSKPDYSKSYFAKLDHRNTSKWYELMERINEWDVYLVTWMLNN